MNNISINKLKKKVSLEALKYIKDNSILGIGSGSTISYFINYLKKISNKLIGVVSSSKDTSEKLKKINVPIIELNKLSYLDLYIDSADEINKDMQMIKGGGAALTKEKIIASFAKKFICIVDKTKLVKKLGKFPLPIEIIPMAKSFVSFEIKKLGGIPKLRKNIITDNGNYIIDVHKLKINNVIKLEKKINNIPGVVTVGLFSIRKADILLIGYENNIKCIKK